MGGYVSKTIESGRISLYDYVDIYVMCISVM